MAVRVKRIYEAPEPADGYRLLVDRLWPRGVSKENLSLDAWMREVAPSSELRRWLGHDASRWQEFKRRYAVELGTHQDLVAENLSLAHHDAQWVSRAARANLAAEQRASRV